ncbi:N-terminal domain of NEFA-interacting nuclear protein NIP30 [Phytophthora infestans]|uniref:N-terminal domain of NEFA-interacting nuclear protein NIP30 n=2 Tax=Phytophthora infestans TaxID=4787 RepID=A0A833SJX5_PHYIN|nr:N-terminal domain of NEFA-interacting nuclear protein NIP30 [Phytophthora infestans]
MDAGSNAARASLAGFVSTSVLTSSDGLFGDNVEEKRVSEAPAPRSEDAAGYKPLYEQLQERKERKDSEWKEKNNPFAPPKGLDDEEFEYIQDLESKREDVERQRQAQHEEDLAQFLVARGAPRSAAGAQLTSQHLQKFSGENELKTTSNKKTSVVMVKAKRKAGKDKVASKSTESTEKAKEEPQKKKQKVDKSLETKSNTAALGLAAYGSESDSDEADTS